MVAGTYLDVPFTTTTVQAVATTDVGNYRSVSVQQTSQGTSSLINFQQSNDNTNWQPLVLHETIASGTGSATSVGSTAHVYAGTLHMRYFRLNVTGISAGTTAGIVHFSTQIDLQPVVDAAQSGTWTVGSNSATGSAVPANAFAMGVSDGTNLRGAVTATAASNTTGTGLLGTGVLGHDGTNYQRLQVDGNNYLKTVIEPTTAGGTSIYSGSITNTVTSVKSSAGQLYGWHLYNPNASAAYVQIFNLATGSVTLGTTGPTMALTLPANSGATMNLPQGIPFGTAISIAVTTTRTGSTAPGSSCDLNFFYL
jgi:hypothetical protein